jgi:4-hydroxythreonine-4-phosphate dehydrogenase
MVRAMTRHATRRERNIVITLGDAGGVGPEVSLKAIAAERKPGTRFFLLGDPRVIAATLRQLKLPLKVVSAEAASPRDRVLLLPSAQRPFKPGLKPGCREHAQAAMTWLQEGAGLCLEGKADALVTAPVNKESIMRAGYSDFVGQTELLSGIARARRTAMMLLGQDDRGRWLRVALATIHVPLKDVARKLTRQRVQLAIELAAEACRLLQLPRCRVGVCGLNPHAGEGGLIGTEELTVVQPAVRAAGRRGLDVVGPLAADTLFHYALRGEYDAVVAMYHDQGLAPLKMIAFDTGVNWTLGLPFVRTSPDHGTAYDIAGRGLASPASMQAAIRLAEKLS